MDDFESLCWSLWRRRDAAPALRLLAHLAYRQIRNMRINPNENLARAHQRTRRDLLEAIRR